MTAKDAEDLLTAMIIGIILGGRLGFVIFYQPAYYLENPQDIIKIWQGGMSFHGGFLGVITALIWFCWSRRAALISTADALALVAPIGIFFGRLANFINAELWGRPTTSAWGVIFPGEHAQTCPEWWEGVCARHPSQLYEAALEGLVLFVILAIGLRLGWLKKPGLMTGIFIMGYGLARTFVEFFRQADAQFITPDNPIGFILRAGDLGLTMGQLLSLPMVAVGLAFILWSRRRHDPA